MRRPFFFFLLVATAVLQGAETAPGGTSGARRDEDPLVARGKGVEVRQSELDDAVVTAKVSLGQTARSLTVAQSARLEAQALERLIVSRIVEQRATEEDRKKAREEADKVVVQRKQEAGSEDAWRRQVLAAGSRPEAYEARLFLMMLADQVINREVRSKLEVTDDQVKAFYSEGIDVQAREILAVAEKLAATNKNSAFYRDATNRLDLILMANRERLNRPEQARARLLVLFTVNPLTNRRLPEEAIKSKRQRIEQLRDRVKAGEDFAKLAAEFSEEPDAAKNQGVYVAVRERVQLPELEEALFNGPLNQVSDVITTRMGCYLVEVLERTPAGKPPLEEVADEIRGFLLLQEVQQRLPAWTQQLLKEYEVEIVDPARR